MLNALLFIQLIFFILISIFHIINTLGDLGVLTQFHIHNEIIPTIFEQYPVLSILILFPYCFFIITGWIGVAHAHLRLLSVFALMQVGFGVIFLSSLMHHLYWYHTMEDAVYSTELLLVSSVLNGLGSSLSFIAAVIAMNFGRKIETVMQRTRQQRRRLPTVSSVNRVSTNASNKKVIKTVNTKNQQTKSSRSNCLSDKRK